MKKQKGITLIALIITIIVMLILVGTSVSVALKGGLFKTAKQAVEQTKAAVEEESSLKYEYEIAKAQGEFTGRYDEYVLQEKYGLKIGDKIDYIEGTTGTYEAKPSEGAGVSYTNSSNQFDATLTGGTYSVDGANSTITAGDLEWQVLGLNDEGKVELISATPTTAELTIGTRFAYNNVENILNNFCNNLYGKGKGAEKARSLAMTDFYKMSNTTPKVTETKYTIKYDATVGKVKAYKEDGTELTISKGPMGDSFDETVFYGPGWVVNSTNKENTIITNEPSNYSFSLSQYSNNTIAKLLFGEKESTGYYPNQYISCQYVKENSYNGFYATSCIYVTNQSAFAYVGSTAAFLASFSSSGQVDPAKVRPIVVLKDNVTFSEPNSDGVRSIIVNE